MIHDGWDMLHIFLTFGLFDFFGTFGFLFPRMATCAATVFPVCPAPAQPLPLTVVLLRTQTPPPRAGPPRSAPACLSRRGVWGGSVRSASLTSLYMDKMFIRVVINGASHGSWKAPREGRRDECKKVHRNNDERRIADRLVYGGEVGSALECDEKTSTIPCHHEG